jgi:hypothetical protein
VTTEGFVSEPRWRPHLFIPIPIPTELLPCDPTALSKGRNPAVRLKSGPSRFTKVTKRYSLYTPEHVLAHRDHPTVRCWLAKDVNSTLVDPHGEIPCAVPLRSCDDRDCQITSHEEQTLTRRSASKHWKIPKLVRTMSAHLAQKERISIGLSPMSVCTSLLLNGVGTRPSHALVLTHPSICLGWSKEAMRLCHRLLALGAHVFPSLSDDLYTGQRFEC